MNRANWFKLASGIVRAQDDAEARAALLGWADQARGRTPVEDFLNALAVKLIEAPQTLAEPERWFVAQALFTLAGGQDPRALLQIKPRRATTPAVGAQIAELVQFLIDGGTRHAPAYAIVAGLLHNGRNSIDRVKQAYMRHRSKKERSTKKRSSRETKSR